jgi:hypothetical protein
MTILLDSLAPGNGLRHDIQLLPSTLPSGLEHCLELMSLCCKEGTFHIL